MAAAAQVESACQHPDPDDLPTVCGAAVAADQRCLAHLSPDARTAWLAALVPGSDIDARGVTFCEDLLTELLDALSDPQDEARIGNADFRAATFTGTAKFDGAIFSGTARFDGATFSGAAGFSSATFSRDAVFAGATFTGTVWFNGATFSGNVGFIGVTFCKTAWFSGAIFSEGAVFGAATFTGSAVFTGATFSGDTGFYSATFSGDARFEGVAFSGDAEFFGATFSGAARFIGATFSGTVSFDAAVMRTELQVQAVARRVTASGLRGEGRLSLRLRVAEVDLTDVVLAGSVSVHSLDHPIAGVDETMLDAGAGHAPPVRVVSLQGLDASSVTLTDVDLSQCRFAGMRRADQIVLDGRCVFADGPGGRRRVLAEEHHWRATRAADAGGRPQRMGGWRRLPERAGDRGEVVDPARLEALYRQLRKALEDAKNEPGAADFYYGEMQMRREATTRRTERWLLVLYWTISGYGLRARRALAWLALLTALSIGGLTWFGFPQTVKDQKVSGTVITPTGRQPIALTIRQSDPVRPLAGRIEKAIEVTLNAEIFRNPDADLTTPGRYLNIIVRILGPILLGLTILAIRNQVKR
jgi:uncharacterized protein YjbI with pentapeptide repeats